MDLQFLLFLQSLRDTAPDWVTSLLLHLSEFSIGVIPVLVFALVYWCVDKRTGAVMLFSFTGASVLNQAIKNTACVYRPWIRDSRIQLVAQAADSATGYSFPSGHTTCGTVFYGGVALWLKKYSRWMILPCVLLALATAFSRNWLGAHTPQDVLVALVLSTAFLCFASVLFKWADAKPYRDVDIAVFGILFSTAMLVYITLKPYPLDYAADGALLVDPWNMMTDCYRAAGGLSGFLLGWLIERHCIRFDEHGALLRRVVRYIAGAAAVWYVNGKLGAWLPQMLDAHWSQYAAMAGTMFTIACAYPAGVKVVQWLTRGGKIRDREIS